MSYVVAIKAAFVCFPFLLLLLFLPYMIREYHKYGSVYWYRGLILFSFLLYLLVAYFLVILPLPSIEEVSAMTTPTMRLIPFAFVTDFIKESGFVLQDFSTYIPAFTSASFYVPVFNIFLFIPFGVYLHYYFEWDLKKTVLASFLLSLFFELTQLSGLYFIYPRGYRLFDLDDLLLNTFGGFLGYFLGSFFLKFLPTREAIDQKSLKMGEKVSFVRRVLAFSFDTILVSVLIGIFRLPYSYLWFLGYFGILPLFLNGQTLFYKFFHLKIYRETPHWYSYLERFLFLSLEMYGFVYFAFLIVGIFSSYLGIWNFVMRWLLALAFCIYYLLIFFKMLFHKKLFYEKFSHTFLISALKKENSFVDEN